MTQTSNVYESLSLFSCREFCIVGHNVFNYKQIRNILIGCKTAFREGTQTLAYALKYTFIQYVHIQITSYSQRYLCKSVS